MNLLNHEAMQFHSGVADVAFMRTDKITTVENLTDIVKRAHSENKQTVHCHGVFDLLHIGHIRHFQQARNMGDILIVTLTADRYVDKGPYRPAFNEILRAEAIASLKCVDFVAINPWPTAENTLRLLHPDIFVKGAEYRNIDSDMTGKIAREAQVVEEIGAELAFTEDIVFSSTNLINRYLSGFSEEIKSYLRLFNKRYDLADVLQILDTMSSLDVLIIGDAILDEYQHCTAIGKSSKDPTLALKYQSHDLFAGGVLAVANHVANFANTVTLVTVLGEQDSQESFIRSQLQPNIEPHFAFKKGAPTTVKRRFIDSYSLNKLFEVYVMDDSGLARDEDQAFGCDLRKRLSRCDLVIAADFGHGAISRETVELLGKHAPFLAVNTQANAGNRGFHTISRYPQSDYGCIAGHELRLEMRDLNGELKPLMHHLQRKLGCSKLVVTHGRHGCAVCDEKGEFVKVPSFAQNIVDRVGAGDALLSVTSLAAFLNVPIELLGFIGNVAGSLAVTFLGNRKPIDKLSVKKYIVSLMK